METKIGYKVVTWKLESVVIDQVGMVKYKVDKFVAPHHGCGPLCVFKSFWAAKNFHVEGQDNIFQCEYVPSKLDKIWTPSLTENLKLLPDGTVLASKVKLLSGDVGRPYAHPNRHD